MTPLERLKAQQTAFAGTHKVVADQQARNRAASIGHAAVIQRAVASRAKPNGVEVPRVVSPLASDPEPVQAKAHEEIHDEGPKPAA